MSLRVNGKAYDWGDVDLKLPNLVIEVQEISYDDELEKELVYGKGQVPRGYGEGNYKPSAKMTLLRDDYDELVNYCKRNGVAWYRLQLPSIVVSYANVGGKTISDTLTKVSFGKTSHKAAQGDKSLKIDIDLFVAGIIERNGLKPI